MPQFQNLSDDELANRIVHHGGVMQQAMIAELQRRQAEKASQQFTNIHGEISTIRSELSNVEKQLRTLRESHVVHLWILAVAILTGILSAIAAVDVILKWIRHE